MNIAIYTFWANTDLEAEGWKLNTCDAPCYASARALALYAALGVDPADDEYSLAADASGRWALIGLTVEGHRYAVEVVS